MYWYNNNYRNIFFDIDIMTSFNSCLANFQPNLSTTLHNFLPEIDFIQKSPLIADSLFDQVIFFHEKLLTSLLLPL